MADARLALHFAALLAARSGPGSVVKRPSMGVCAPYSVAPLLHVQVHAAEKKALSPMKELRAFLGDSGLEPPTSTV